MAERDEFDRIVENLELDLDFPDDESTTDRPAGPHPSAPPPPAAPPPPSDDSRSPDVDEEFYRRIDPPAPHGLRRNLTVAWIGVLGPPLTLVMFTLFHQIAPRSVVIALSLVFVASAIWLINQLPERGPSHPDDPDDGAVL